MNFLYLSISLFSLERLQQQMHAQQIPITPPHPIPLAGPLGAFAGPMGLPHGPQALLKVPQELHRDDIKPLVGPSAEERLVSTVSANEFEYLMKIDF